MKESKHLQKELTEEERVLVLTMEHGSMRKLNDYLYITYKDNGSHNVEKIINIATDEILEERFVSRTEKTSITKNKEIVGKELVYHDGIKLFNDMVITLPQIIINNNCCRIYNEYGRLIFILRDAHTFLEKLTELEDNKVIIQLLDKNGSLHMVIYNKNIGKIEHYFNKPMEIGVSKEGIRIKLFDESKGIKFYYYKLKKNS